jgi:hypothetical protein
MTVVLRVKLPTVPAAGAPENVTGMVTVSWPGAIATVAGTLAIGVVTAVLTVNRETLSEPPAAAG